MYISLKKKKQRPVILGLKIYFNPVFVSGVNQKHEEKYNRTSSDPMDIYI